MNRDRRFEILDQIKEWQKVNSNMNLKDCLYTLYNDQMITPNELEYLIDWIEL